MTWIGKMLTVAWVSGEERESWGFTALAAVASVLILLVNASDDTNLARYSCLALPVLVWLGLTVGGKVGSECEPEAAHALPVWILLGASAIGGLAVCGSTLGMGILVGCVAASGLMRLGDVRFLHRRAQVAEQIARGRLLADPWDCEWYGKLADALLAQGKRAEALKALQSWRVRDPWSCDPQRRIAAVRVRPSFGLSPAVVTVAALFAVGLSYAAAAMV